MRATLLLAVCLLGGSAFAQDAAAQLDDADRLYDKLEFARAATLYEAALSRPGLSRALLARAYAGVAVSAAAGGNTARAQEAFLRLLAIEPGWRPPEYLSPKITAEWQRASAFWEGKAPPTFAISHPEQAPLGARIAVTADVASDPLGMINAISLDWRCGGRTGQQTVQSRQAVRFELAPPGECMLLEFSIRAIDAFGRSVLEANGRQVRLVPAPQEVVPANSGIEVAPPAQPTARGLAFAVRALVFTQLLARGLGGEVSAELSPLDWLDAGLGVTIGAPPGGFLLLTAHFPRPRRLNPFIQVRGLVQPTSVDVAVGVGAAGGIEVRLGPGTVFGGVSGELYRVSTAYRAQALLGFIGYRLALGGQPR